MRFLIAAAVTLIAAFALTKPIKKAPFVLYAAAILADLAYAYGLLNGLGSGGFWAMFLPLMQRCTVAMAFLTLVMFIGVLKDGSAIKTRLMPIRRQLSIAGCLLAFCHVIYYTFVYIVQIQSIMNATIVRPGLTANLFAALGLSVLVTALLLVLMVTSFMFVKSRMHAATWKKVQRFSYVFYALICVHLMMIMIPPALAGKAAAVECVTVYAIVFGVYAILRTRRYLLDKKTGAKVEAAQA